jgi:hypothetical protein
MTARRDSRVSGSASQVLERFPNHWQEITELLRTSDAFGSLCEDYADAVTALRAWEISAHPKAPVRVTEYRDLVAELEAEILGQLQVAGAR